MLKDKNLVEKPCATVHFQKLFNIPCKTFINVSLHVTCDLIDPQA